MKDVLVGRHFDSMKEGAIICNTGHYDCEINIPELEHRASRVYTIRENNEAFELADGRTIHLLARGRLVNLAAAEGHPSEVMDMSFANQFLALCRLAAEGEGYDNIVYDISAEQDSELAALKLAAEGVSIDSLTAEQLSYLNDYSAGT
jgi:adenosylhomocysteinase